MDEVHRRHVSDADRAVDENLDDPAELERIRRADEEADGEPPRR